MEKQNVIVPVIWLEGLLKDAQNLREHLDEYYKKSPKYLPVLSVAAVLAGYASSAKYIIKTNERI